MAKKSDAPNIEDILGDGAASEMEDALKIDDDPDESFEAEVGEGRKAGKFVSKVTSLEKGESSNGNPQLIFTVQGGELKGSAKMWHTMLPQTAFKNPQVFPAFGIPPIPQGEGKPPKYVFKRSDIVGKWVVCVFKEGKDQQGNKQVRLEAFEKCTPDQLAQYADEPEV